MRITTLFAQITFKKLVLLTVFSQSFFSLQAAQIEMISTGHDSHSYANFHDIVVKHLALELAVDFERKELSGSVNLTLKRNLKTANKLILDTRDLTIHNIHSDDTKLSYTLYPSDPILGSALEITVPEDVSYITIEYTTSPKATGLQWLTPEQTAGKQHPYLFSQAQAIHARSFIPLQDSPSVRVTYEATIRTPKELLAVMSASNDPKTERDGVYEFEMPQPIPSYLIALAVGDLHFKAMSERTGIYSETAYLDIAAKEFEDTEAMLIATEKVYGPYLWERYDLLILPPSFPYGGMENPRLSFITPTVLAGDKSLVSLIAHELAHSWSGNTVTNSTWKDLWLNEGFTTYLTYRIMEIVYGEDRYNMEAVLGYQSLQSDLNTLSPEDQHLSINKTSRDPDEVFSDIPYEKGALFLRDIEVSVGREKFDEFILAYFNEFSFKSIDSETFIQYLDEKLIQPNANKIKMARVKQWIYEAGIPDAAPQPESDAFTIVDTARNDWLSNDLSAEKIAADKWAVHQWLYFLNNMPEKLSHDQLAELDAAFSLTQSTNNEIAHSWLLICVKNAYEPAYERLYEYLTTIGRNKLIKPLYQALSKTPEGLVIARAAFKEAKTGYHPLTVKVNQKFVE